jgi:Putative prokaryotic signal transducing protein
VIRVYAARDMVMVGHLRNVLELEGVPCRVRNLDLGAAAGELPPTECWPELWIDREADLERARRLIDRALRTPAERGASWTCEPCGERHEGQFTECWKCGRARLLAETL